MKTVLVIFAALYGLALALLAVSTFGLFGQEKDPLGAVFLMPLGLPWNIIADKLGLTGVLTAILAPAINLAALYAIMRARRRVMPKAG
ncbi:hypothetical protein [Novosphingobium sp.]|uniref:hypothetical protein n=1 Tax=Novosphingobium sp. TaxID=1874826 RepID=UPI0025D7EFE2|nr:hypothetical protein [Novosphingobium sp.]